MTQNLATYNVWIGGSCDYDHKKPTHVSVPGKRGKRRGLRTETKHVWSLPCKKEEDESQSMMNNLQQRNLSQR